MLSYMEQKYREPFTEMEPYAGQFGKDYTMLKVRSSNSEGILVRASGGEDVVFQDNYLAFLLKEDIEQSILELAEPVFGECKVFYRIPELVFPAEFPADMTADAFLRHPLSRVRIYVYVKKLPQDGQKQFDEFLTLLTKREFCVGGVISYPKDEEMYEMINEENFRGDIYQGYQSLLEAIFSMDEKGELLYLEWKGEVKG